MTHSSAKPKNATEMADYLVNDLKVPLFPAGKVGERALVLWHRIRKLLLRGETVEIGVRTLGIDMHRQQLKRARDAMVAIDLIRPNGEGRYKLGRYDALEEAIRQEMHFLREVEDCCRMFRRLVE